MLHDIRLLVSLQMLVAAERLVAAGVVALAHGSADDIDTVALALLGHLSRSADLGTLELGSLALNLVHHHLAVGTEAVGGGRSTLEVIAADGRLRVTLKVERLEAVGGEALLLGEESNGAVVGARPR